MDGQLFFSADNGTKGDELWKSDGTNAGTTLVKDIWPGIESGAAGNFSKFINKLLFTGNDGVSGYTTWQSDGSAEGTKVCHYWYCRQYAWNSWKPTTLFLQVLCRQ